MSWLYIFIASIFEICWSVSLKYSHGFTRLYPTIFTFVTLILSFVFLSQGAKELPIGTAYAVWTGIGIVGTVIYEILFMNESTDILRLFFLFLIVIGIIGVRLTYQSN